MGLCLGTNRKMANSLQLENRIAKELECPICLCQIQKPKMLPCQHSFCLDPCLRTLVEDIPNGGKLKCPICQRNFNVPIVGGVDAFPDNLLMKSLLETKFAPSTPMDKGKPNFVVDYEWNIEPNISLIEPNTPNRGSIEYFFIENHMSRKCLRFETGMGVMIWSKLNHNMNSQLWFWDGSAIWSKKHPGYVLDLDHADHSNTGWGRVLMWLDHHGNENQMWKYEGDELICMYRNLRLDVKNSYDRVGGIVGCAQRNNSLNQKWSIKKLQ